MTHLRRRAEGAFLRVFLAASAAVVVSGCAMIDYFRAPGLSPLPVHRGMEAKEQCMHCHTAGIAGAPQVPHPQYKHCSACHKPTAVAAH